MTEEQYIQKGFNAGYQMEKHDSKLAKTLQKGFTDKEHPYVQGFIAGSKEYGKELAKTKQSKAWNPKITPRNPNISKNKDKGKGFQFVT